MPAELPAELKEILDEYWPINTAAQIDRNTDMRAKFESALLAAIPIWNVRMNNRLDALIEQWEEYYTAFTSPFYKVSEPPDAMKGLRQCIDELKAAKDDLSRWKMED